MRRYWLEKKSIYENQVLFRGDVFHHIFDVCRQDVGHQFEVLTEDSKAFLVEVVSIGKKEAIGKILESREIESLKKPYLHIVLSVPRFQKMDLILEKAVELGVSSLIPVVSDFSFVRKSSEMPDKGERWNKIIRGATQQSGRGDLLQLKPTQTLVQFLEGFNPSHGARGLFAYEGESAILDIKSHLRSWENRAEIQDIFVFVGSEGGFSAAEVQLMQGKSLTPVTLGAQVLRVETACFALVSVLKYEFDLMCQ
ncbi:MAG: 16S rRNA (uracil(1498)-N(3))-methyltransferase [Pseudobdellovibrionaceae bacterium]